MKKPPAAKLPPFRDRKAEESLFRAVEIGTEVVKKYHRKLAGIEKKGAIDLVTQADKECEARIFDYLSRRHPNHTLVGEESWDESRGAPEGLSWILDPVDGTTNYAHGMDHYGLSLALALDGEPVAGVVADPAREDIYRAIRGRGAFRNTERIRVSKRALLGDSLLATGFPYDVKKRIKELMPLFAATLAQSRGIRRFGVASLDLAYTAAGHFDAYFENPLHAWDIAAGVLLVTEAGGQVTDYSGGPLDLFKPALLASNGLIHDAMLRLIKKHRVAPPAKTIRKKAK